MRKFYLFVLLSLVCIAAGATYKPGYYNAMDGKSKDALKTAAKTCVINHIQLGYTGLPDNWVHTDVYPDLYNGQKRWWEMYSNEVYLIRSGQSGLDSFRANKMQREHSVPKSWWGGEDVPTPAYSDIFNLYPSDGPANQAKSNYPLGEVGTSVKFNNGVTKVGNPKPGYGGSGGFVFEPADEYKGDFARAYFYVFTVYDDLNWTTNSMGVKNSWPTLKPWAYELLLQWSRQDPVSQKEIQRNDAAEIQQGNRNPFIDFPELAEYIWGTKTTEIFYISEQGGSVTPPITGDPELTSPVSGESLDFSQVAVGGTTVRPLLVDGSNLRSPLSVRITGEDKEMFFTEGSSIPAASVNAEGGFKLNITYRPSSEGEHTARLILYDGGFTDGQQFVVNLRGEAFAVPQLTAPTANAASNVTETSYQASWEEVPEPVDFYRVTRTRYQGGDQVTTTYDTPGLNYTFDDRDSSVEETYYVQSSRLGYFSPKSNTVIVSAGVSVDGIEAVSPLVCGTVDGGFIVLAENGVEGLRVHDVAGRVIVIRDSASYGETILLPRGMYIISAPGVLKPVKIIVN